MHCSSWWTDSNISNLTDTFYHAIGEIRIFLKTVSAKWMSSITQRNKYTTGSEYYRKHRIQNEKNKKQKRQLHPDGGSYENHVKIQKVRIEYSVTKFFSLLFLRGWLFCSLHFVFIMFYFLTMLLWFVLISKTFLARRSMI